VFMVRYLVKHKDKFTFAFTQFTLRFACAGSLRTKTHVEKPHTCDEHTDLTYIGEENRTEHQKMFISMSCTKFCQKKKSLLNED